MEKEHEKSLFDDLIPVDDVIKHDDTEEQEEIEDIEDNGPDDVEEDESEKTDDSDIDPRVEAIYTLMTENEIIAHQEGFKPTLEGIQALLEELPEKLFTQAAESLHPDSQSLAKYMFQLGDKADFNALKKFFDAYSEPELDMEDEEKAEEYLKLKLKNTKFFPNEEKLNKYLSELKEDGTLTDTAKQLEMEEKEEKNKLKEQEIIREKEQRVQRENEVKEYYSKLRAEVDSMPWKAERKKAVLQNLQPDEVARKNQLIRENPNLLIQLADIYSRLDVEKKQFDLSDLELKTDSKKAVEKKDTLKQKKVESVLAKIQTGKDGGSTQGTSFWSQLEKIS